MPSFNSKNYEWSDVSARMMARTIEGLQSVKYSVKQEQEFLRGRGKKPLAIQAGNETIEGEIEVLQAELDAMIAAVKAAAPTKRLTDVSFDLVVQYNDGTTLKTDILLGCRVSEYEKAMSQGDKFMKTTLKFMALDIQEGV